MVSSFIPFACLAVLLASSFTTVTAKKGFLARVEYAGSENTTTYCSAAEWARFNDYVVDTDDDNDDGYDDDYSTADDDDSSDDRRLEERQLLGRCKGGCKAGYPYCQFTGTGCIVTTRRRTRESFLRQLYQPSQRQLQLGDDQYEGPCGTKLMGVRSRFQEILPQLASPCQQLMRDYGRFSCEELIPCTISHFSLWNVATNTKTVEKFTAMSRSICVGAKVTIEAVTNFNIGPLEFNLVGPTNVTKIGFDDPYFITAGNQTMRTLQPLPLVKGDYKLHAWPEGDRTKTVSISFKVRIC